MCIRDRDSNIEDADSITIKRVTYRNETETHSVDFETVKKNSKDVDLGETKDVYKRQAIDRHYRTAPYACV